MISVAIPIIPQKCWAKYDKCPEKEQDAFIWVKGHKTGEKDHLLGLEVSLTLNRKDFGLDWGSPRLGETVKVIGHLLYKMKIEVE